MFSICMCFSPHVEGLNAYLCASACVHIRHRINFYDLPTMSKIPFRSHRALSASALLHHMVDAAYSHLEEVLSESGGGFNVQ